ncbi:MRC1-like domain-containing protein [Xylaria palmicola]|nr:MRC1-like domain-containing protein [Xylaria palmicola]
MASTRASSPVDTASISTSPHLTPRSKLKALLAAVDDGSSDDEIKGPINTKSLFAAIDKNKQNHNREQAEQDSTDEEEDEGTEIIRPRGRMAARMHASFSRAAHSPDPRSSAPRHPRPDGTSRSNSEHSNDTQDPLSDGAPNDEDDVKVPSRRRLTRPNREVTPETAVRDGPHSSPSLFVSPSENSHGLDPGAAVSDSDDDNDVPLDLSKNARFKALVERKRKERQAKEAEKERERTERAVEHTPAENDEDDDDDVSDISDDDGGRKLTQNISRPSRKASKKAIEEINRETQRLSRSLQLAHEAKTKKKISKATLFQRFNFRTEETPAEAVNKQTSSSRPTTPESVHQTDAEPEANVTPPSSPPTASTTNLDQAVSLPNIKPSTLEDGNASSLTLENALVQSKDHDKNREKAVAVDSVSENKQPVVGKPLRRVRVKLPPAKIDTVLIDSDDELEVTNPMKRGKLDAVFARIPENRTQESSGMKILRHLAHLSSPPKESTRCRNVKPSMTFGELHLSLQQRAKAQAKLERERRLEFLRSKGIVVQSAEEREREQEQVEDIVAKARQEVEEIMLREREEAKRNCKEKKQSGDADPLAWDDSDDDSFQDEEEAGEVELSGSDEDEQEDGGDIEAIALSEVEEMENGIDETPDNDMFVEVADEAQSEDEETKNPTSDFSDDDIEAMKRPEALRLRRVKKYAQIVSDDEDGDVAVTPKPKRTLLESPAVPGSGSPKPPTSVLRSATKTFIPGLPIAPAAPAGLGLTQMFAGTMDDSQVGSFNRSPQVFMPSFDQFPDSQFSATASQSQGPNMIVDSQPNETAISQGRESQTQGLRLHYSQSQAHGFDSFVQGDATQISEFGDLTQDGGFQDFTPLKQRFVDAPSSTVGTIMLASTQYEATVQESPLMKKRGKLLRRVDLAPNSTSIYPEAPGSPRRSAVVEPNDLSGAAVPSSDAFRLMEKAAKRQKRLKKRFDRKKSKATEMIEEQAEESDDEYAGLGGADGEDSSEEDEEFVKEMIDDTRGNDGDAAKLAGLFADRERAADAAQVDKLFRDITTGMLRKRRRGGDGHDFDLSDSDDGGEARRRMKRRQFAKMQKALFADERIGKIAENPRNAAFLKSIEDMNYTDEWEFGENFADTTSTSGDDSRPQNAEEAIPDSQPPATGRKRSREDDHAPRPGPSERRARDGARPSSIAEVRRSLSALLDEPNASAGSIIPATDVGSDSEGEERRPSASGSNKENSRPGGRSSCSIVDRIMLKRQTSSFISVGSASTTAKLAFTAPSTTGGGFKVPALLRRATTNSSKLVSSSNPAGSTTTSNSTSQASTSSAGSGSLNKAGGSFSEEGKLKKNAGKRSGINYFAHENERRAKVADAEKRREAKKWKGAEGRSKVVGGLFGSGSFE